MYLPGHFRMDEAAEMHRLVRQYPLGTWVLSTEQGLQALVAKPATQPVPANWRPYIEKLPTDPWGQSYQYLSPGVKGEIDVISYGADGKPGGEGVNADIDNWQ